MKKILFLALTLCLMLPMTAFAASERVSIDGDHGKLSAIIQRPDGCSSYPMVMLLHGFTSSKEDPIITHLADGLEKNGIASIRFDFNGHGESEGRFQDMTVPNEIEDAKKVYAYVKALPDVTSVSIAGHSQGGVVTSMTAGELGTDKVKAIVLLAPAAVLREDAHGGANDVLTGSGFARMPFAGQANNALAFVRYAYLRHQPTAVISTRV